MILTGEEIRRQVREGRITVEPYNDKRINPASLDLTLGDQVAVYQDFALFDAEEHFNRIGKPYDGTGLVPVNLSKVYDTKKPSDVRVFKIDPKVGWVIQPGIGYLMHTVERISTDAYNPVLDGKSSLGRIFLKVHETAGYGDPGFNGQFTLEVTSSMFPIRLYPGMRICQVRFHTLEGAHYSYKGHYTGEAAKGPIASRVHESAFD